MNSLTLCAAIWFALIAPGGQVDGNVTENSRGNDKKKSGDNLGNAGIEKPETDKAGSRGGDEATDDKNKDKDSETWWLAIGGLVFSAVVAIAAVFQAIIARYQWGVMAAQHSAMLDQIGVAERQLDQVAGSMAQTQQILDHMRLEQRPWLGIAVEIEQPLIPNQMATCATVVKNFGLTPAHIKSGTNSTYLARTPIDFDAVFGFHAKTATAEARENVVPPGFIVRFVLPEFPVLDEGQIAEVNNGNLAVVVTCTIWYTGIVNAGHETQACFRYDAASRKMIVLSRGNHML